MATIYGYRKDGGELKLPDLKDGQIKEVATIDGVTYVALSEDVKLDEQAKELALFKVDGATLGAAGLKQVMDGIAAARPETATINAQVLSKIREKYAVEDEIRALRLGPGTQEWRDWNDYVEACVGWGREEKGKMGLGVSADVLTEK